MRLPLLTALLRVQAWPAASRLWRNLQALKTEHDHRMEPAMHEAVALALCDAARTLVEPLYADAWPRGRWQPHAQVLDAG